MPISDAHDRMKPAEQASRPKKKRKKVTPVIVPSPVHYDTTPTGPKPPTTTSVVYRAPKPKRDAHDRQRRAPKPKRDAHDRQRRKLPPRVKYIPEDVFFESLLKQKPPEKLMSPGKAELYQKYGEAIDEVRRTYKPHTYLPFGFMGHKGDLTNLMHFGKATFNFLVGAQKWTEETVTPLSPVGSEHWTPEGRKRAEETFEILGGRALKNAVIHGDFSHPYAILLEVAILPIPLKGLPTAVTALARAAVALKIMKGTEEGLRASYALKKLGTPILDQPGVRAGARALVDRIYAETGGKMIWDETLNGGKGGWRESVKPVSRKAFHRMFDKYVVEPARKNFVSNDTVVGRAFQTMGIRKGSEKLFQESHQYVTEFKTVSVTNKASKLAKTARGLNLDEQYALLAYAEGARLDKQIAFHVAKADEFKRIADRLEAAGAEGVDAARFQESMHAQHAIHFERAQRYLKFDEAGDIVGMADDASMKLHKTAVLAEWAAKDREELYKGIGLMNMRQINQRIQIPGGYVEGVFQRTHGDMRILWNSDERLKVINSVSEIQGVNPKFIEAFARMADNQSLNIWRQQVKQTTGKLGHIKTKLRQGKELTEEEATLYKKWLAAGQNTKAMYRRDMLYQELEHIYTKEIPPGMDADLRLMSYLEQAQKVLSRDEWINEYDDIMNMTYDDLLKRIRRKGVAGVDTVADDIARREVLFAKRWVGGRAGRKSFLPEDARTATGLRKLVAGLVVRAMEGIGVAKEWYRESAEEILQLTGGDIVLADKLTAAVAIYSPQQSVTPNVGLAYRAMTEYLTGGEVLTGQSWQKARLIDVMEGRNWLDHYADLPDQGIKIRSFYGNLLWHVDEDLARAKGYTGLEVTADGWIGAAFGYGENTDTVKIDANEYRFMERVVQDIHHELQNLPGFEGTLPMDVQAAIWVSIKAERDRWLKNMSDRVAALSRAGVHFSVGLTKPDHQLILTFEDILKGVPEAEAWDATTRQGFAREVTTNMVTALRDNGFPAAVHDSGLGIDIGLGSTPAGEYSIPDAKVVFANGLAGLLAKHTGQDVFWARPFRTINKGEITGFQLPNISEAQAQALKYELRNIAHVSPSGDGVAIYFKNPWDILDAEDGKKISEAFHREVQTAVTRHIDAEAADRLGYFTHRGAIRGPEYLDTQGEAAPDLARDLLARLDAQFARDFEGTVARYADDPARALQSFTDRGIALKAGRDIARYELPPVPGSIEPAPGYVRLYHYTKNEEDLPLIVRDGIRIDKAVGEQYGEPNMVWGSTRKPSDSRSYVEFHVRADDPRIDIGSWYGQGLNPDGSRMTIDDWARDLNNRTTDMTFRDSILPSEIVSYNEPWMETARYVLDNEVPLDSLSWMEDTADDSFGKAIAWLREREAAIKLRPGGPAEGPWIPAYGAHWKGAFHSSPNVAVNELVQQELKGPGYHIALAKEAGEEGIAPSVFMEEWFHHVDMVIRDKGLAPYAKRLRSIGTVERGGVTKFDPEVFVQNAIEALLHPTTSKFHKEEREAMLVLASHMGEEIKHWERLGIRYQKFENMSHQERRLYLEVHELIDTLAQFKAPARTDWQIGSPLGQGFNKGRFYVHLKRGLPKSFRKAYNQKRTYMAVQDAMLRGDLKSAVKFIKSDPAVENAWLGYLKDSGHFTVRTTESITESGIMAARVMQTYDLKDFLLEGASRTIQNVDDIPIRVGEALDANARGALRELMNLMPDIELQQRKLSLDEFKHFTPDDIKNLHELIFPSSIEYGGRTWDGEELAKQLWKLQSAGAHTEIDGIVWVPRSVVEKAGMLSHKGSRDPVVEGLLQGVDTWTAALKLTMLQFNPAYYTMNMVGNTVMAVMQQGWFFPANLYRAARINKTMGEVYGHYVDNVMGSGTMGIARLQDAGLLNFTRDKMNLVNEWSGKMVDVMPRRSAFYHEAYTVGIKSEKDLQAVIDLAMEGDEKANRIIYMIADRAKDELVNFERLNFREKTLIRRIVFFYPWMKGATRWTVHFPLNHPVQAAAYAALFNPIYSVQTEMSDKYLGARPWYQQFALPIPWFSEGQNPWILNTKQMFTFSTPFEIASGIKGFATGKANRQGLIEFLTPVPSAGVQALAGKRAFDHQDVPQSLSTFLEELIPDPPWRRKVMQMIMGADTKDYLYPRSFWEIALSIAMGSLAPTPYNKEKGTWIAAGGHGPSPEAKWRNKVAQVQEITGVPLPERMLRSVDWKIRYERLVQETPGKTPEQRAQQLFELAVDVGVEDERNRDQAYEAFADPTRLSKARAYVEKILGWNGLDRVGSILSAHQKRLEKEQKQHG